MGVKETTDERLCESGTAVSLCQRITTLLAAFVFVFLTSKIGTTGHSLCVCVKQAIEVLDRMNLYLPDVSICLDVYEILTYSHNESRYSFRSSCRFTV